MPSCSSASRAAPPRAARLRSRARRRTATRCCSPAMRPWSSIRTISTASITTPSRDFVLVAPLATMPFVLLVNTGVPVDTRRKAGGVAQGAAGRDQLRLFRRRQHRAILPASCFAGSTGVNIVHVSYNGGIAALNGLATGQVSLMFAALPLALPYLGNEHFKPPGRCAAPRRLRAAAGAADARRIGPAGVRDRGLVRRVRAQPHPASRRASG